MGTELGGQLFPGYGQDSDDLIIESDMLGLAKEGGPSSLCWKEMRLGGILPSKFYAKVEVLGRLIIFDHTVTESYISPEMGRLISSKVLKNLKTR